VITARELLAKAERAAASAKLLLEAGDADGACNRSERGQSRILRNSALT